MRLREQLAGTLPGELLQHLSNHFNVIGDIAILTLPPELLPYKQLVAAAIITNRRNIYTVLNKTMMLSGDSRTASYEILTGTSMIARYQEFGFQYRFNVSRVFFNVHLAYERMRIADQVEPGERVLVPFCGVGPFAIPAAAKGAEVIAIENNPDAYHWLQENVALNRVRQSMTVILGDAFDTSLLPRNRFDRAIVPTPYGREGILEVIAPHIHRGGLIHYYTFRKKHQIPGLLDEYEQKGFSATFYRPCGNVAPGVSRWVFDLERDG